MENLFFSCLLFPFLIIFENLPLKRPHLLLVLRATEALARMWGSARLTMAVGVLSLLNSS